MIDLTYFMFPEAIEVFRERGVRNGVDYLSKSLGQKDHIVLAWGNLVAQGPRMFRIPPDVFDSMRDVELRIKASDFKTPFPVFILEHGPGRHVLVHSTGDTITFVIYVGKIKAYNCTLVLPHDDDVLEDVLSDVQEFADVINPVIRSTVNCCLLLGYLGVVRKGWAEPKERARHERSGRFLERDIEVYETRQCIQLWAETNLDAGGGEGGGGGWTVRPHWRRGHWQMVACGKGRKERRLRFFPAVMVNKDLFKGKTADTQVVYA